MKVTICLFIISSLDIFIKFANCEDPSILNDPIATKTYPKKFKRLQILNPRKFLKVGFYNENRNYSQNKLSTINKERYTFFPVIYSRTPQESAFLQPENYAETKVRVKKVLPDYLFTLTRGKRSINKDEDKEEGENVTKRRKKKNKRKGRKTKDGDKLEKHKTGRNSRGKNKKSRVRSKHKENDSTPRLKYTVKRMRQLRKGKKHVTKNRQTAKPPQNVGRNQRKKKLTRDIKKDTRRLIASRDARMYDYPYVVSIQKGGEHWCAGALANPQLVVTTANCVWKSDRMSRLRVRAGSRHADRGGQMAKIQEIMKHPKWSIRGKPDNDLALLLLDRKFKFSDKVHGLDLPNRAMEPSFGDAWVTSWGAERRDGIFENTQFTLQVYHAKVLERDKCNNVTQRFGVRVSENFFCLTQSGRRAPCTRDTGAPAVSDGVLWGVASWGLRKRCGTERFPAMFSYLASPSNVDFIMNATHYLMSEQRFNPFPGRFQIKHAPTPPELNPNDYL